MKIKDFNMDLPAASSPVYLRQAWSVGSDRGHGGHRKDGVVIEEELDVGINGVDPLKHLVGDVRVPCVALKEISVQVLVVHVPVEESVKSEIVQFSFISQN